MPLVDPGFGPGDLGHVREGQDDAGDGPLLDHVDLSVIESHLDIQCRMRAQQKVELWYDVHARMRPGRDPQPSREPFRAIARV